MDPKESIKMRLIEAYQSHGYDFMTAASFATDWLRALKKEPPGTVWTLGPTVKGITVTVRRNDA